jgi:hypothetical protein
MSRKATVFALCVVGSVFTFEAVGLLHGRKLLLPCALRLRLTLLLLFELGDPEGPICCNSVRLTYHCSAQVALHMLCLPTTVIQYADYEAVVL